MRRWTRPPARSKANTASADQAGGERPPARAGSGTARATASGRTGRKANGTPAAADAGRHRRVEIGRGQPDRPGQRGGRPGPARAPAARRATWAPSAVHRHRQQPGPALLHHLAGVDHPVPGQHPGRPHARVPGEGQLADRGEDAQPVVRVRRASAAAGTRSRRARTRPRWPASARPVSSVPPCTTASGFPANGTVGEDVDDVVAQSHPSSVITFAVPAGAGPLSSADHGHRPGLRGAAGGPGRVRSGRRAHRQGPRPGRRAAGGRQPAAGARAWSWSWPPGGGSSCRCCGSPRSTPAR